MEYFFQWCPFWGRHIYFSCFILSLGSSLTFHSSEFVFPDIQQENLNLFLKYVFFLKKSCLLSITGELFTGISVRKYICIVNPEFLPWCTRHLEKSMAGNWFFSSYKQCWMVCGVFCFFLTPIFQASTQVRNFKPCGCLMSCLSVSGFYDVVVSPQGLTALLPKCQPPNIQSCNETFNAFDQVWLGLVSHPFLTAWNTACCLHSFLYCFMKPRDRKHH